MRRANWHWPEGKPIAVILNVCLEAWSDGKAPGISPMGNPLPPGALDTMAISWAAYGQKCGVYRLIDVLKVQDVTNDPTVEHELAFIKVRASERKRSEVITIVEMYKGRIVDVAADSVIVEAVGTEAEVDALIALLRGFGIKELVRTGAVVMSRGSGSIQEAIRR